MAVRAYAAVVVCCLLLQGVYGACPPTFGADYTCVRGIGPTGQDEQLCPSSAAYTCYTPDALKVGGAAFGCGGSRTCSDGKAATTGTGSGGSGTGGGSTGGGSTGGGSGDGKTGSVSGDPFLEGFDGRTFDFMGAKGQVFNMITHPDHQLNAAFIDAEFPAFVNGTFIGGVGILHRSHQVQAHVLNDGTLDVIADGVALTPDHGIALGDASVELDAFGTALIFKSELCIWKIVGVAPYTWKDDFYKAHIDMQLQLLKDPSAMHGVLGQTVNSAQSAWPEEDLEFHGEGVAEDYKIGHLLSTDFKYNMFGKNGPTPLLLTRARMLLASAVSKTAVSYPSFASISTHPHARV